MGSRRSFLQSPHCWNTHFKVWGWRQIPNINRRNSSSCFVYSSSMAFYFLSLFEWIEFSWWDTIFGFYGRVKVRSTVWINCSWQLVQTAWESWLVLWSGRPSRLRYYVFSVKYFLKHLIYFYFKLIYFNIFKLFWCSDVKNNFLKILFYCISRKNTLKNNYYYTGYNFF
jgi:hypothetical protein